MNAPEKEVVEEVTGEAGPGAEGDAAGGTRSEEAVADATVPDTGPAEETADHVEEQPDPASVLEAERDHIKDQHLRLAADFDNYRKRTEDRMRLGWNRAQADLVGRLLDPLDDLRRVTALEPETTASVDAIVEGVDLVERKFFRALEEAGVEIVDPEGEHFDPNTMEAMMRMPTDEEEADDTVAQVFQRGYTMKGILIRPARVSVFKAD